jgi:Zn-dependent protease with chaperone function
MEMDRQELFHNAIEYVPRSPWQARPYVITIFAQALVAWMVRLPIIAFLLTPATWFISDLNVPLLAFIIAFGPIAWSLAAFAFPGGGWWWRRHIGAREPSNREYKAILDSFDAIGERAFAESQVIFYILPHPEYFAFARGRVLVYSSGLVKSDYLSAATAHEIAHLKSDDAILMQALDRFVMRWGDPLPVFEGMSFLTFRNMIVRLVSGRLVLQLLKPMWADYFRQREQAADEHAAKIGLGHLLAQLLETWELPREIPNPRILFNMRDYMDPELRIQILTEEEEDDFGSEPGAAGSPANESDEEAKMRRIWEHIEDAGSGPDRPYGPIGAGIPPEPDYSASPRGDPDVPEDTEEPLEGPEESVDPIDPVEESEDRVDPPEEAPDPPKKKRAGRPKKKSADPPKEEKGSARQAGDPPPEVSDPRNRWADLLVEDDGPLEEPEDMPDQVLKEPEETFDEALEVLANEPDDALEEPEETPDEAEGLEGPPQ